MHIFQEFDFQCRYPPQISHICVSGGMQAYEAAQWALKRLNQDQGTINGQRVTDSYIPGVKLGKFVGTGAGVLTSKNCLDHSLPPDKSVSLFVTSCYCKGY